MIYVQLSILDYKIQYVHIHISSMICMYKCQLSMLIREVHYRVVITRIDFIFSQSNQEYVPNNCTYPISAPMGLVRVLSPIKCPSEEEEEEEKEEDRREETFESAADIVRLS